MMKVPPTRLFLLVLAGAVIPACFRDEPRGNTTFVPGASMTFKAAVLSGGQEVPAVASPARGDATIEVDPSGLTMTVTVQFTGLANPSDAHVHVGEVGVDGPIIFPLASGPFTSPLVVTLTQGDLAPQPALGVATFSEAVTAVLQGRTYVNLHTTSFPDGEIRGQVGPVTLEARLDGLQEAPPVLTAASGQMIVTLNNDQSAMTYSLNTTGLSNVTEAHLHAAPAQVDGPIVFPLGAGPAVAASSGSLTAVDFTPQPVAGVTTFEEAIDALLSGRTYANVHTALYPDGEIRGQLLRPETAPPTSGIPPTTTTVTPPPLVSPPTTVIDPYFSRDR